MKPYHQQSYYELLEIAPEATPAEIRAAYERAAALYSPDSVAIYSLADPAQADDLRKRILEAFEYLSEPDLRREYDKSIGVVKTKPSAEAPPPRRTITPEPTEAIIPARPLPPAEPEAVTSSITPPSAFDREPAQRISPPEQLTPRAEMPLTASAQNDSPSQLSMNDLLAGTDVAVASTNYPKLSVSYIPHPPRPDRTEGVTLAGPSWASSENSSDASTAPARTESAERRLEPADEPPAAETLAEQAAESDAEPEPEFEEVSSPEPSPRPPPIPSRVAEPIRAASKRPDQLAVGAEIAQESAIAAAEAALAQVASRVREGRPKPFDIPPDAEFNGELLRKIRQAKNLSLSQVAERTKISGRHLENVEADRYDALPPPVYLRGIIMNIAREYGLDPLRVSKSYLGLVPGKK